MTMLQLPKLIASRAGNVGIILALAAIPVVACAGAAMDYVYANQQRTELQARLDTAVLAAVSGSTTGKTKAQRRTAANRLFKENCNKNDCAAKLKLTFDGSKVRGTAEFDMPTAFMRVVGINQMPIAAVAEAAAGSGSPTYFNVHLSIDISESMGIGATIADQQRMQDSFNCVFACHINQHTKVNGPGNDTTLERARNDGIPLRLDAAKAAAVQAVDYLEREGLSEYLRIGVYPFHNVTREAVAPTVSYDSVRAALTSLQLADNAPKNFVEDDAGDTYANRLMDFLDQKIKTKGSGTAKDPYNMVVLISDGASTNRYPAAKFKTLPIDPAQCDKLRKKGVLMAVVHTNFVFAGPSTDWAYVKALQPVEDQLGPNMEACADEGMYYSTDTPDDIAKAMEAVVGATTAGVPRLVR